MAAVAVSAIILLIVFLFYPLLVRRLEFRARKISCLVPSDNRTRSTTSGVGGTVANIALTQSMYTLFLWYQAAKIGTPAVYAIVLISTMLKVYAAFRVVRVLKYSILEVPDGYSSFYRFFLWSYIFVPISLLFDAISFVLFA